MMTHLIQFRLIHAGRLQKKRLLPIGKAVFQSGMTLIEFMVGITIGLLVVLAAVSSLIVIHSAARTIDDSSELEQQASLAMMQIGQQIQQTGAINAYLTGTDPNAGTGSNAANVITTGNGKINFDFRPLGINSFNNAVSIFGTDGDSKNTADTLTISYAAPNDGSLDANCIGNKPKPTKNPDANGALIIVSVFSVSANHDLVCGNGIDSPQPIASNVLDLQVQYLIAQNNNISYQTATQINQNSANWTNITGLQICLEMQGDPTQAPQQTHLIDCQGNPFITPHDGRVYHFVKQIFYLRN